MKIEVSKLQGVALDWAVAKCHGKGIEFEDPNDPWLTVNGISDQPLHSYTPSIDWAQGGPIIERMFKEGFQLSQGGTTAGNQRCWASRNGQFWSGPTPLIAAMRCYVEWKLGSEIEVPDELVK
jgi:hypothetical protein